MPCPKKRLAMIEIDGLARDAIEARIGAIRTVKPLYPAWKRWAGWGGATQPGVVEGRHGRCKIVVLRPDLRADPRALEHFTRGVSLYQGLARCRGLPGLIHHENHYMVAEWWEGDLLADGDLLDSDVDGLARITGETYARMEPVPNPMPPAVLLTQAGSLRSDGLISAATECRIERFLLRVAAPEKLRRGPCFGDVSLKNFLRRDGGEIGYIDTMGVDIVEMPINIEKTLAVLGSQWAPLFLSRMSVHEPSLGSVGKHRAYFQLALCLRQISAKSKGGRGLVAVLRRLRAAAAVRRLPYILQTEGSDS